jgi:hypothetical protein
MTAPAAGSSPTPGGLSAPGAPLTYGATPGLDAPFAPDALRQLVREVLREILPAIADQPNPVKVQFNGSEPAETQLHRVPVRLASDEDLHAFVVEVLRLAGDPQRRLDLLAGRLGFTLASASEEPVIPKDSRQIWPQTLPDHEERRLSAGSGGPAGPAGVPPSGPPPTGEPSTGEPSAGEPRAGEPRAGEPRAGEPRAGAGLTVRRVEKGAVTERAVIAAAKAGERLVLGPRAVLTPLARDKARALGVPIEKER